MICRLNKSIPVAAMLLLHMLLYSGMASFTLRQKQVERLGSAMLPFLVCIAFAGWFFPKAAGWFRQARAGTPSRFGRWRLLPVPLMLAFFPLTLLAGYHEWVCTVPLRHVINFPLALQIPAAYHVFYTLIPPRRRGVWFGAGVAAAFLTWRTLMIIASWMGDGDGAGDRISC